MDRQKKTRFYKKQRIKPKGIFIVRSKLIITVLLLFAALQYTKQTALATEINHTPTAVSGSFITNENTAYNGTLTGHDDDLGDILSYNVTVNPLHGTVSLNSSTGQYTYTPDTNYSGIDSFQFAVTDSNSATSDAALIAITVNAIPTASDLNFNINEDSVLSDFLQGTDSDGADTLVFWQGTGPPGGTLVIDETDGSFSYTPASDYYGTVTFTYTVSDSKAQSAPATVTIHIAPVNDTPSFTAGSSQTVLEDASLQTIAGWAAGISAGPSNESDQTLHFNITTDNDGLFEQLPAIDPATGNLTYKPAADRNGTANVSISLSDSGDGSNTSADQTFSITVVSVNDAPFFTKGSNITVGEDSGVYSASWATAISRGNTLEADQTVTFHVTTNNDTLFQTGPEISPEGILTFTPKENANGIATVTVILSDNGGTEDGGKDSSEAMTFVITISPDNDAPTISAIADQSMNEDASSKTAAFTVGDIDNEISLLTITAISDNTALIPASNIVISGTGAGRSISFYPAENQYGTANITLTVSDGDKYSEISFKILVASENDLPKLSQVADQTINEDVSTGRIEFTVEDVETLASALVVTVSSSNTVLFPESKIELTGTTGKRYINLTPAANLSGTATITLTVEDLDGGIATITFTVEVKPVNDLPSLTIPGTQTISEDGSTGTLSITVGDVETAANDIILEAISGNTNIIAESGIAINGSGANRTIKLTPVANASGTVTITIRAKDENGGITTKVLTVVIQAVNDAPVFDPISNKTISEDMISSAFTFTVSDIDNNEAALVVSAVSSNDAIIPTWGGIILGKSAGSRTITFIPAENATGTVTITMTVSDGSLTDTITFQVTVENVNDAPYIGRVANHLQNISSTSDEYPVKVYDIDNEAGDLSLRADYDPEYISAVAFGGSDGNRTVKITTTAKTGTTTIRVYVTDPGGLEEYTEFTVEIVESGGPGTPIISYILGQSTLEDTPSGYIYFDVEQGYGDNITVTSGDSTVISGDDEHIILEKLDLNGTRQRWRVAFNPLTNQYGTVGITITATNSGGDTAVRNFNLTVIPVNDAPVITGDDFVEVNEDNSIPWNSITVSDVDADDVLSITVKAGDQVLFPDENISLTTTPTGMNVELTPAANVNGTTVIIVTARDRDGAVTTRIFTVKVNAVNDAPTISTISNQSMVEDTASSEIHFTVGDVELKAANLTLYAESSNTNLISNSGIAFGGTGENRTLVITPVENANTGSGGTVGITVYVSDGVETTHTTFYVTISPVNDAPNIGFIANQTIYEDASVGPISFTIGDIDSDVELVDVTASSGKASLIDTSGIVIGGSGANRTITLTPLANAFGSTTITIRAEDAEGAVSTRSFTFTVLPVNDVPTIISENTLETDEDTELSGVTITISDLETAADSLTYEIISGNQTILPDVSITKSYTSGGTITLTLNPALNQNGIVNLVIKVSDGTATTIKTIRLNVKPVNDRPTISSNPASIVRLEDQTIYEDSSTGIISFYVGDVEKAAGSLVVTATSSDTDLIPQSGIILGGTGANRTIKLVPLKDQYGTVTITVTVTDGELPATDTFIVTILPVDDIPSFTKGSNITVLEDSAASTITGWATNITKGPSNEETQTLEFLVTAADPSLFLVQPAISDTGVLTFTPKADAYGTTEVTVQLRDSGGTLYGGKDTTAAQTFTITITPVNDKPSFANAGDQEIDEDAGAQTINHWASSIYRGADNESEQTLQFIVTNDKNSLFTVQPAISADGTLTYTPKANANGIATVTVYLKDSGGVDNGGVNISDTITFTITINAKNDTPTLSNVSVTINEDTNYSFKETDFKNHYTDVDDGEVLTKIEIVSLTNPSYGTLYLDNGTETPDVVAVGTEIAIANINKLYFKPVKDWYGGSTTKVSFGWTAYGTMGESGTELAQAPALVYITVNPINDEPTFSFLTTDISVDEDAAAAVTSYPGRALDIKTGADNETQTLTFHVTVPEDKKYLFKTMPSISVSTGELTFELADDANGEVTLTIWLTDNGGTDNGGDDTSASVSLKITVNPVNDKPSLSNTTVSTNEDTDYYFKASDFTSHYTDVDTGEALTKIKIISFPNSSYGSLYLGSTSHPVSVDEEIDLADISQLFFRPVADWYSSESTVPSFEWTAYGNMGAGGEWASNTVLANITVVSVNDIPTFSLVNTDIVLDEDAKDTAYDNRAYDISTGASNESQTLTFHVTTDKDSMFKVMPAIDPVTGRLTFTLADNANGEVTLTIWLTDDGGTQNNGKDTSLSQTLKITVGAVNDKPVITASTVSKSEDNTLAFTSVNFTGQYSDVDDDPLTKIRIAPVTVDASKGTLWYNGSPVTGSIEISIDDISKLSFVPVANWNGTYGLTWEGYDGKEYSVSVVMTISITAVNDAPVNTVIPGFSGTVKVGSLQTGAAGTWDDTKDTGVPGAGTTIITYTYQWQVASDASGTGAVNISGATSINFTPTSAQAHKYIRLVVTAKDNGIGTGAPTTVAYSEWKLVENTAPVVKNFSKSATEDTTLTFTSSDFTGSSAYTDADTDALTKIKIISLPANGTLYIGGIAVTVDKEINVSDLGTLTFVPAANWNGATSFQWNGCDGTVYADENKTVTITVNPVNDAPVNTVVPGFSGTVKVDNLQTGESGTWNDIIDTSVPGAGTTTITYTYQWQVASDASGTGAVNISGATSINFTPTSAQAHKYIRLVVTAKDDGIGTGTPTTVAYSEWKPVENTTPVVKNFSKSATEDTTLTFTSSDFTGSSAYTDADADALTKIKIISLPANGTLYIGGIAVTVDKEINVSDLGTLTFVPAANWNGATSFQWNGCDGTVYADENKTVTITVNPVNDAPVNTVVPGFSGTVKVDNLQTGESGTWNDIIDTSVPGAGTTTITYTYQWQVASDASGTGAVNISGATSINFTPTSAQAHKYIRLVVTAKDDGIGTGTPTTVAYSEWKPVENTTPVVKNFSKSATEDTTLTFTSSDFTGSSAYTDADADALTKIKIISLPANGTLYIGGIAVTVDKEINVSDLGTLTFVPDTNWNGTTSFQWNGYDGRVYAEEDKTVTITVNPVNDIPVANGSTLITDEDTAKDGQLTGSDVEGSTLTYQLATNASHGNVVLNPDGSYTYTPVANYNGSDSFTFTVSDGSLTSVSATVTITVNPVNDAPVANASTLITDEDIAKDGQLTGSDVEGSTLTYQLVTNASHGNVVLNPDGSYTYTLAANYNGSDSFTFTVSDGSLTSTAETVMITVNPVNDAPVANASTLTTDEDIAKDGQLTGSDVEGSTLTYQLVTNATHGNVVLNPDGSYTYTPAANYNGSDSFTFTVSDGSLTSTAATVTITVNPVNDAPVANASTLITDEDTTKDGQLTGSDVEGSTLTYQLVTNATHGNVVLNPDGSYTYTPGLNYNGSDSFTFTVSDGSLTSTAATVTITVNPVNDAPIANNSSLTTDEDTAKDGQLSGSDVEGSTLTYQLATNASHGNVILNADGSYTYTPAANYNGSDSFTFTVSDGSLTSTAATVTITVNPVNDAPVANNSSLTTDEDTAKDGQLTGSDVEESALTYQLATNASHGNVVLNADGSYTYTPAANYNGSDSFTYTVYDGTDYSLPATVTITVNPVNDAPSANASTLATDEDTAKNGQLTGSDVEGSTLTYQLVTDASHGNVVLNADGSYIYTPALNYNGSDSFTFTVSDGSLISTSATVTITVNPVNDAPVADTSTLITDEDTAKTGQLSGSDVEGSTLTYQLATNASHGNVILNADGSYTYTPAANYNGSDSFTFTVSDGSLTSTAATVTITVNPVNDAPVANNSSLTTDEDTTKDGQLTGSDVEGSTLTYQLVTNATHGNVVLNVDGSYTYTPAANYNGSDSFTFTVSDGSLTSVPATVTITVNPVNDVPVANASTLTTDEDTAKNGQLTGSDVEGSTLTYQLATNASHGSVTLNADGSYIYTPALNYNGSDSFTFTVRDGSLTSVAATVTITVNPVNDTPIADTSALTTDEDTAKIGQLSGSDVEGSTLTYQLATNATHGSVTLNADGSYTYTPAADYYGNDSFTFTVSDGSLTSVPATVTITVNPVNDAPVNTVLPGFGGTVIVEQPIAAGNGSWNDTTDTSVQEGSSSTITYSWQWQVAEDAYGTGVQDIPGANSLTFTPTAAQAHRYVRLVVTATDNGVGTETKSTVAYSEWKPVKNTAPTVMNFIKTVDEDGKLDFTATDFSSHYTDADEDTMTKVRITGLPAHGTLKLGDTAVVLNQEITVAQLGELTYIPETNWSGIDSLIWTGYDGMEYAKEAKEITIRVTSVNDAPTANESNLTTQEDTAKGGQLSGNDIDAGTVLSFELVSNASHGNVVLNVDGSYTYTPAVNYNGSDSFTFRVSDGSLTSLEKTVTITVNPVNDAPVNTVIPSISGSMTVGTVLTAGEGSWNDTADTGVPGAGATNITYIWQWQVATNANGTDAKFISGANAEHFTLSAVQAHQYIRLVVTATDDGIGTENKSTVAYSAWRLVQNTRPEISDFDKETEEDLLLTFHAADFTGGYSDADADPMIAIRIVSLPAHGSLKLGENSVTAGQVITAAQLESLSYLPEKDWNGIDSFTWNGYDAREYAAADKTVTITVHPVNDAPEAENSSLTTDEDTAKDGQLTGSDVEGSTLSYLLVTNASHGSVLLNADGSYRYTPAKDYYGEDSFTFRTSDGSLYSTDKTVSITVNPVNDAPVNTFPPAYGGNVWVTVPVTPDNGSWNDTTDTSPGGEAESVITYTYQWQVAEDASGTGTHDIYGATGLSFIPTFAQAHKYIRLVVTATDNGVGIGNPVTIAYSDWKLVENTAPVVTDIIKSVDEDTRLAFTANDFTSHYNDADQDSLTKIKILSLPTNAVLLLDGSPVSLNAELSVSQLGGLSLQPDKNWHGTLSFSWTGYDGYLYAPQAKVIITVNITNDEPTAEDGSLITNEDTSKSGQLIGNDTDTEDTLSYVLVTAPVHGKVTVTPDGQYTYVPYKDYYGNDSFTFKIYDGMAYSNIATISITVISVNDAPVAGGGSEAGQTNGGISVTTKEDTSVSGKLTGSDVEGNIQYQQVSGVGHGTLIINSDGSFTYTPEENYNGKDSFTYRVSDGALFSDSAVVSIEVLPVNDDPVMQKEYSAKTTSNTKVSGSVSATDVDGDTISYKAGQPAHGAVTIEASTGRWVYTPAKDYGGADSFQILAEDGKGGAATTTVQITVTGTVTLKGVITDRETGKIIAGAKIVLTGISGNTYSATTDSSGRYQIDNVKIGTYTMTITSSKYSDQKIQIVVSADGEGNATMEKDAELVDFTISLTANPTSIIADGKDSTTLTVTVRDKNNKPLTGVSVSYTAAYGTFIGGNTGVTDADGMAFKVFQSSKLESDTSISIPVTVTVEDKERNLSASSQIVITFEPGAIVGVVYDNETGKPIEGAVVEVSKDFDGDGATDFTAAMTTGKDGKYKIAVPKGNTNYTIKITKPVKINEETKLVTFTQDSQVGEVTGDGKEEYIAEETAAGMILLVKTDGSKTLFQDYSAFTVDIYNGNKLLSSDVSTEVFNGENDKGIYSIDGLEPGKDYVLKVKYTLPDGEQIIVGTMTVSISEDGEMNLSSTLIDPYGIITDAVTGEALSGVEVKLYYADTKRNREAGRLPGTLVELPLIEGFEPFDNANPQTSDIYGKYAYMVFPYTDYYIVAVKDGYEIFTSPTISVEEEIVKFNFEMVKEGGAVTEAPKTGEKTEATVYAYAFLALLSVSGLLISGRRAVKRARKG